MLITGTNCRRYVVTMDAIRDMNATMLLGWVQGDEDKAKLLGAEITGSAFLQGAKDRSLFREAGLAVDRA